MFRSILRKEYRRAVGTHYWQTRVRQAKLSLCHRRDGRAGTTILQLVLHPATGPKHFRATKDRQGCWSMGNAAASAGAEGPFYGTTGRRKQRVAAAELSVPQDLSKDHGPTESSGRRRRLRRGRSTFRGTTGRDGSAGLLCWSTPQQADDTSTRPSGSWPTSKSNALDFGPTLLHANRPTGRGPGSQITSD
jgi:hypothetical protein